MDKRKQNEIEFWKKTVDDAETYWGWTGAAGSIRSDRRVAYMISKCTIGPGKNILEIGCGTGIFTEKLAHSGAHITALDLSPDLLSIAKKRSYEKGNVSFLLSDAEKIDAGDSVFDAVVGVSVLHHVSLHAAIPEFCRVLKSGAPILFSEPNMLNPQIAIERNIPGMRKIFRNTPDETAFFRWGLKKFLLQNGFKNVEIKPFDWLHPLTPKPIIPIVDTVGKLFEKIPIIKELGGSLFIYAECSKKT